MPELHLVLYGKVQGVGLRIASQMKAQTLNLTGFVRNKNSGEVEITVLGLKKNLQDFLFWIKSNPGSARVKKIQKNWRKDGETKFSKFNIF